MSSVTVTDCVCLSPGASSMISSGCLRWGPRYGPGFLMIGHMGGPDMAPGFLMIGHMGGPDMAPQPPQQHWSRPGGAVALLEILREPSAPLGQTGLERNTDGAAPIPQTRAREPHAVPFDHRGRVEAHPF